MMNMILSIIVCFAMILGGTGAMPAQPETATTWTIRNVTIDNGTDSVTLTPEVRITTAMGAEKGVLHFEVGTGEQTILPASGEITAEGVRFALGNNGRSYSVSEETLMEEAQLGEADLEMISKFSDFFVKYGTVLGKAMYDNDFAMQFGEASMNALLAACETSAVETEIEIEGVTYPAQQLSIEVTGKAVMAMLDSLLTCGVPEVEAMIQGCIDLINATGEMEITSLGELAADMEEDIAIPMEITIVEAEDFTYEAAVMEMEDEETGATVMVNSEYTMREDTADMIMNMTIGDEETAMVYDMSAAIIGPAADPAAVDMNCGIYFIEDYSSAAETEDEEDYTYTSEMAMFVTSNTTIVDGLKDTAMTVTVDTLSEYGYGDDVESTGESFAIDARSFETIEDDGSVTTSWSVEAGMGEGAWVISFDVNRAEAAVQDYFAGCTDYAITSEVIASADGEQASQELMLLGTDAMSYVAEAYALTMDESVISLMEMFTVVEEEYETHEEYEEYEDESYEDEEAVTVYSYEEAAEIYKGVMPEYTAPEGYELKEIVVDPYNLYATYEGENSSFELSTYDYYSEGTRYYSYANGELTAIEGDLVEMYSYDGEEAGYADVAKQDCEITFYFTNMSLEEAGVVLAGLK